MEPFQAIGLALVVAAIVGGGLEAAGFKIGVVESRPRQLMLAGLGAMVFIFGTPEVWSWARPAPMAPVMSSVSGAPTAPPTLTSLPSTAPAPSATAAPAATQAPAGRTPILPAIRKDGDRRP